MRRRWIVAGVVAALVGGAVAVVALQSETEHTRFATAVSRAPASTVRFGWTDWTGVRTELGSEVSASSSPEDVEDFLLEAFDHDLGSASALDESAPTIHAKLGFSPATIDWELYAQGNDGALLMMGLPKTFDYDALRDRLRSAGFREPADDDGVWNGGVDLLSELGGTITPELAALRIDEKDGMLIGSDRVPYLEAWSDDRRGYRDDGVSRVVDASGDVLTAYAYTGDYTCSALAMTDADPTDRTRAAELIEQAGKVHPLTGYAIGEQSGDDVRVAMAFEEDDQARADADVRSRLAVGEAPGHGGTFPERFKLGRVVADGKVLTMDLAPVDGSFVVSELSQGPVLFATC